MSDREKIAKCIELIEKYGDIDGGHHKQWVLDQIARVLLGNEYDAWAAADEEADIGEWDTGIAP